MTHSVLMWFTSLLYRPNDPCFIQLFERMISIAQSSAIKIKYKIVRYKRFLNHLHFVLNDCSVLGLLLNYFLRASWVNYWNMLKIFDFDSYQTLEHNTNAKKIRLVKQVIHAYNVKVSWMGSFTPEMGAEEYDKYYR